MHAGYTATTTGEEVIQAHYCSANGRRKQLCNRQGRDMHERFCKYHREQSIAADENQLDEDTGVGKVVGRTELRDLFRAALEAERVVDFIPILGRRSTSAVPAGWEMITTTNNKVDDYKKKKTRRKKNGKFATRLA